VGQLDAQKVYCAVVVCLVCRACDGMKEEEELVCALFLDDDGF
jgi:hypothetical protein